MNQFTVPQFIEHKPKIVGPMTFQQFIYVGAAGVIGFLFYFTVPFYFFILITALLMSLALALAFGSSNGRPLPLVFKNFFTFTLKPKIYLWKKKVGAPPKLIELKKPEPAEIEETPVPTMVGKSRLGDVSKKIETGE